MTAFRWFLMSSFGARTCAMYRRTGILGGLLTVVLLLPCTQSVAQTERSGWGPRAPATVAQTSAERAIYAVQCDKALEGYRDLNEMIIGYCWMLYDDSDRSLIAEGLLLGYAAGATEAFAEAEASGYLSSQSARKLIASFFRYSPSVATVADKITAVFRDHPDMRSEKVLWFIRCAAVEGDDCTSIIQFLRTHPNRSF